MTTPFAEAFLHISYLLKINVMPICVKVRPFWKRRKISVMKVNLRTFWWKMELLKNLCESTLNTKDCEAKMNMLSRMAQLKCSPMAKAIIMKRGNSTFPETQRQKIREHINLDDTKINILKKRIISIKTISQILILSKRN